MIPSRAEALAILSEYIKSDSLLRHAFAVEGVMRRFAGRFGGDADAWGIAGLLHDIDYERFPDEHCSKAREILGGYGVDEILIRACVSHGYGVCSDVEPVTDMERALFAVDELTGLIAATALMRPSRSVDDLEAKSVMKKFKTPAFAAGCDRSLILKGCEALGMAIEGVVSESILGMREASGGGSARG